MPAATTSAGGSALVTGGASGIGAATAARLRHDGAEVAVFDREPVEGFVSVTGDISSPEDVNAAVAQIERDLGRIDILVNSAGVPGESLRTVDVTDEEWQRVLAINATASSTCAAPSSPGWSSAATGGSSSSPRSPGRRGTRWPPPTRPARRR